MTVNMRLLVDAGTGFKLAGKAEKEQMYPASMTKIMTAILALEKCPDLDEETMTVPSDIFDAIYSEQASTAGFEAGEVVTVRDLLYGVMLPCRGGMLPHAGKRDRGFRRGLCGADEPEGQKDRYEIHPFRELHRSS